MSWNQFEATEAFMKCYFEYLVLLLVAEIHLKCISKKKLPVYVPIYLRKNDKNMQNDFNPFMTEADII